jgi:Mrp family chromosome partitioning ATPase
MAQAGDRLVLVDADLRRSKLHKKFEVLNRRGLPMRCSRTNWHWMAGFRKPMWRI